MSGEANLWSWLSKARLQLGPELDMNRIENELGGGMPDVEGARKGVQFWCELKSNVDRPARASTPVRFKWQDRQVPWAQRRWSVGGRSFALCAVGKHPHRIAYLVPAPFLTSVQEGVTEEVLASFSRAFRTSDCQAMDAVLSMCGVPKNHLASLVKDGQHFLTDPPFTIR